MPSFLRPNFVILSLGINSEQVQHPLSAAIIEPISSDNLGMVRDRMYMGFLLVPKLVTFNGIMAIILCYFTEFGSLRGQFDLCKIQFPSTYNIQPYMKNLPRTSFGN